MPGPRSRERLKRRIEYRDREGRVWQASQVATFRAVSPSIDGPNLCLVIRFERDGEEIFASWIGDPFAWQGHQTLHRLFAAAEPLNNE